MHTFNSISEFLLQAGTQYRVYDFGRGIHQLDTQTALAIENGELPAPRPRQKLVWLALVFWNKQSSQQHYIWFIKLPLDETGCVVTAHRDQFLSIIVDALGEQFIEAQSEQQKLPDNPYSFEPSQQQMSDFNGIVKCQFNLPAHDKLEQCENFLRAPSVVDWRDLPLQALSDFIARLNRDKSQVLLNNQLQQLPHEVLFPMLTSLENQIPDSALSQYLVTWLEAEERPQVIQFLLRALAQSNGPTLMSKINRKLINIGNKIEPDIFVIVVGRHWHRLTDQALLIEFLDCLAHYKDDNLFVALYSDLAQIPSLRRLILSVLREPNKSPALQKAIGSVYSSIGKNQ